MCGVDTKPYKLRPFLGFIARIAFSLTPFGHRLSIHPALINLLLNPGPTILRCVLLAVFVLGAVAQPLGKTCDAISMTVSGGPCDGMKAPEKACGAKSYVPWTE